MINKLANYIYTCLVVPMDEHCNVNLSVKNTTVIKFFLHYYKSLIAIFLLFFSLFYQIFWPASTSKVEECQMAGKDPTVRPLTLLNSWHVIAAQLFYASDSQQQQHSWFKSYLSVAWWSDHPVSCFHKHYSPYNQSN